MRVKEFMQLRGPIDPDATGAVTNDDMLTAVNISGDPDAHPDAYVVVYGSVAGVDAKFSAKKQTKTYLYQGDSTTKTGTQRTFKVTGDRELGDEFQDFALSHKVTYGVGEAVVTDYIRINILNGKGEKGKLAIIVNADGSGNAGESAGVDIDLEKTRAMPIEYIYAPEGELAPIIVTSAAGSETGKTMITASPAVPADMTAMFTTGAGPIDPPAYDEAVTGWQAFASGGEYDAVTGNEFAVAYVDAQSKAKYAGKATVIAAE